MDLKQDINKHLFKNIIKVATKKALLISSIILEVSFISQFNDTPKLYIISIKIIIMLVIFCYSTHQNNNNYPPFIIAFYLYLASTKVDTIIFLNYFGLLVFYNILQTKLQEIISTS